MARVTIELPTLLQHLTDGEPSIEVNATTLRAALEASFERVPALRVHIMDESGDLRQHVLCFHNGVNTRWEASMDRPVNDGDQITIMQAVSGG